MKILNYKSKYALIVLLLFLATTLSAHADINRFLYIVKNAVIPMSDVIFLGKLAGYKTIENGFVTTSGENLSVAVIQVEVVKVLRGKIQPGEKQLVCSWFVQGNNADLGFNYGNDGDEITVLGVETTNSIQLPHFHYHWIGGFRYELEIMKWLKLPQKPIKDKERIFKTLSDNYEVVRNACNEPNLWP
ncbi:hypothetical protein [Methylobacter sp.]|uniref:hypothetical protein n=1 Tax=Methylobacter sp. TaxID=2051955 RepID=UPI0011FFB827|nr:hypothetical protein [Methylobacter sp.]TAK64342.1 MAG: hypothetical protein EPO18_03570 [Methylobacter sp.]